MTNQANPIADRVTYTTRPDGARDYVVEFVADNAAHCIEFSLSAKRSANGGVKLLITCAGEGGRRYKTGLKAKLTAHDMWNRSHWPMGTFVDVVVDLDRNDAEADGPIFPVAG